MKKERALPANREAEAVLLGAIITGNKFAKTIFETVALDDFDAPPESTSPHKEIYRAMLSLDEHKMPVDLVNVYDELVRTGKLEDAYGRNYLAQLGDQMPEKMNVDSYIRSVKAKARLRAVIHAAGEIEEHAHGALDEVEVVEQAIEKFSQIARELDADKDESVGFRDAAVDLLWELEKKEGIRIVTDVSDVDKLTGGFRPGEVILFTAETGVGKTLLAQQTRRRACRDGYHCLYASGEMLARHLVSRELATAADVEHWKLRRNERLTPEDWKSLTVASANECNVCRVLDGELTIARICRTARRMKGKGALHLVIIDYDELVGAPGKDEFEQQRNIVRSAKSLAMELEIPLIIISQLRKALQGEDRKHPTLQRLYGSGAKPKHSSIVIYVDRPFVQDLKGDETAARIVILKSRDGRIGSLDCVFNIHTLRFESTAQASLAARADEAK